MRRFYFIGIGGSATAAVAAALKEKGDFVFGSDNGVYPPISGFLEERKVLFYNRYNAENLRILCSPNTGTEFGTEANPNFGFSHGLRKNDLLIIIGNAISRGNPEVEEVLNYKLPFTSLAQFVGSEFIEGKTSLVVTGTHGKTTVSSLAAWTLESAGKDPGFLIGGIPENFHSGCKAGKDGGVFVTEGDEYDTAFFDKRSKFVHYRPDIGIINNIEFDHADIFRDLDDVKRSFRQFVNLLPGNGLLIANGDDHNIMEVIDRGHTNVESFGLGEINSWRATNISGNRIGTIFEVARMGKSFGKFHIPISGEFNVRNALAVIAAMTSLGLSAQEIQKGFSTFTGVKRRMEVIQEINGVTVIDDFAHHPTAVRETLKAVRERYGQRRIVALFEPRSNTSTRSVFQKEFADSFDPASFVVIGAIDRPDRYSEEERLSPERLVLDLEKRGITAVHLPDPDEIASHVADIVSEGDVIVLLSNGKFGGLPDKIQNMLQVIAK